MNKLNELSKRFNNYDYTISEIQTYEAYLFAVAYYYYVMLQTQNKIKQKDICKLYNMDVSKFSRLANNCENGIFKNVCQWASDAVSEKKRPGGTLSNLKNRKIFKMSIGGKYDPEVEEFCLKNNYIALGWGGDVDFSKLPKALYQ